MTSFPKIILSPLTSYYYPNNHMYVAYQFSLNTEKNTKEGLSNGAVNRKEITSILDCLQFTCVNMNLYVKSPFLGFHM